MGEHIRVFFKNTQSVLLTSIRKSHVKAFHNGKIAYISICLVVNYWVRFPHQSTQKNANNVMQHITNVFRQQTSAIQGPRISIHCSVRSDLWPDYSLHHYQCPMSHRLVFLILILKAFCFFHKDTNTLTTT